MVFFALFSRNFISVNQAHDDEVKTTDAMELQKCRCVFLNRLFISQFFKFNSAAELFSADLIYKVDMFHLHRVQVFANINNFYSSFSQQS